MSILISIGSDPEDINRLKMMKDLANFVTSLMRAEDHSVLFAESNYTNKQIEELSDWIEDILFILYNGGNLEDVELEPNLA